MTHTSKTFYFKNIMAIHGERERHPYAGWEKASPIYRQKGNPQTGDNLQFLDNQAGKRLISAPRRLLRRYDLRVFRGGWKVPPIWENQQKYGYPIHQTMPRIASRASFRPYQITFQDSFGLYQITFQDFFWTVPDYISGFIWTISDYISGFFWTVPDYISDHILHPARRLPPPDCMAHFFHLEKNAP